MTNEQTTPLRSHSKKDVNKKEVLREFFFKFSESQYPFFNPQVSVEEVGDFLLSQITKAEKRGYVLGSNDVHRSHSEKDVNETEKIMKKIKDLLTKVENRVREECLGVLDKRKPTKSDIVGSNEGVDLSPAITQALTQAQEEIKKLKKEE